MNLRLAVENETLASTRVLGLYVVIVDLKRRVSAGTGQSHDVMFAVVDFNSHFTQTMVISADVVRRVQMSVNLKSNARINGMNI